MKRTMWFGMMGLMGCASGAPYTEPPTYQDADVTNDSGDAGFSTPETGSTTPPVQLSNSIQCFAYISDDYGSAYDISYSVDQFSDGSVLANALIRRAPEMWVYSGAEYYPWEPIPTADWATAPVKIAVAKTVGNPEWWVISVERTVQPSLSVVDNLDTDGGYVSWVFSSNCERSFQ
jgi:hypothetical protein